MYGNRFFPPVIIGNVGNTNSWLVSYHWLRCEMITVSVLCHSPHYFIHGVYHVDVVTYMKVEVFIFTSKLLQQELASQGKEG